MQDIFLPNRSWERVARRRPRASVGIAVLCLASLCLCSCRDHDVKIGYVVLSGEFEKIDLNTGVATYRFRQQKTGRPRTEEGWLGAETEVVINGRLSELSDIRLGEPVSAVWRVRKAGAFRRVDALKIRIVRDDGGPET